jgi:hypothetical protein
MAGKANVARAETSVSGFHAAMLRWDVTDFMMSFSIRSTRLASPRVEFNERMRRGLSEQADVMQRIQTRTCDVPRSHCFHLFWPVSGLTSKPSHLPMHTAQWSLEMIGHMMIVTLVLPLRGQHTLAKSFVFPV